MAIPFQSGASRVVEYMLSGHHVCGFSVSGTSETSQESCKMLKDKKYSYFYVTSHSGQHSFKIAPSLRATFCRISPLCDNFSVFILLLICLKFYSENITCYKAKK